MRSRTGGLMMMRRLWAKLLRESSPLLDDKRLRISSDGLETPTAKYSWRAFSGISEITGFVLLWFDPSW
jgi:hypothetical protein